MISLLIGNKKSKNNFSSLLLGNKRLKDSDRDKIPDIFDCKPKDKKRDSYLSTRVWNYPPITKPTKKLIISPEYQEILQLTFQEYMQQEYEKVKSKITQNINIYQEKIDQLNKNIKNYENELSYATGKDWRDSLRKDIQKANNIKKDYEQTIRGYQEGLQGTQEEVLNKYESGYTQKLADYYSNIEQEIQERYEQKKLLPKLPEKKVIPIITYEVPEGYYGISTPQGVIFEKIPSKPAKKQSLFDVIKPPETPFSKYIKPTYEIEYEPSDIQLPYQTRGTSSTIYTKPLLPKELPKGKLFEETISLIQYPGEFKEKLFEDRPLEESTLYMHEPITRISKETLQYDKPKLTPYENYIKKLNEEKILENIKLESKIQKVESQEELDRIVEESNKKLKDTNEQLFEEYRKKESKEKFTGKVISGILTGALYTIPYYGKALFFSDIYTTAKESPQIYSFAKKYPKEFLAESTLGLTTGFIGAGVASGIKSSLKSIKIKQALSEAEIISRYKKGTLTESDIKAYNIDESLKVKSIDLLKSGYTVKEVKISLKPKEGLEKYTPKIEGRIIEITDQKKNVIDRMAGGKLTAKLEKKKLTQDILVKSYLEINEKIGGVSGYTEILESIRPKSKPLLGIEGYYTIPQRKGTLSKFYEESKITGLKEERINRFILGETESELLGRKKVIKAELLKEVPEFELIKGTGKPYSKGEFFERQKLKNIKVDIRTSPIIENFGLVNIEKTFDTFGIGKIKRVKEKIPKVRPMKSFKEKPLEIVKFEREKPPKNLKGYQPQKLELIHPSYTGGEGGQVSQSLFYGKQFLIPSAWTSELSFAGLPSRLSGGIIKGSIISGMGNLSNLGTKEISGLSLKNISLNKNLEISKEKTKLKDLTKTETIEVFKFENVLRTEQLQKQELKQEQKLKQELKFAQPSKPPLLSPPLLSPILNFFFPEETFRIGFPEEKKQKELIKQGYDSYALIESTKPRKIYWKKLNKKPLTQKSALSLSAEYVDNSISAKGKIAKSKSKIEPIDTKEDYFGINKFKFRTFQQRKGVKTKLPNQFIEKRRYRLDKIGEVKKIQKERLSSFFGF